LVPEKLAIPKDDFMTIVKNKYEFDIDNGKVIVKQNGEILKDNLLNPLDPKVVIEKFISDNPVYLGRPGGGSGDGDSGMGGGAKKSIDKFIDEMAEKGIQINSPEFNKALEDQKKAGLLEL
jgi:hypothetical protein